MGRTLSRGGVPGEELGSPTPGALARGEVPGVGEEGPWLTFEEGVHPPDGDGAEAGELAEGELHVEDRKTNQGQHQEVWNQKRPW